MRVCLPLDFAPGAEVPLAAIFEAASRLSPQQSLVVCPTERTTRLFPLLRQWVEEEGHLLALWQKEADVQSQTLSVLIGVPPRILFIQGEEVEFQVIHLEPLSKRSGA